MLQLFCQPNNAVVMELSCNENTSIDFDHRQFSIDYRLTLCIVHRLLTILVMLCIDIKTFITRITSLPRVIWEEGRVAALSDTYAVKSPLVTMARPKFAPKSTPSCGQILKPHHVPHLWTRPTYDIKRHPDPIRRFSTMHWTGRQTDGPTDRSFTGKFYDYRPLRSESDAA